MGCSHSKTTKSHCPTRVDLPLDGTPAWRCATVKPRPKGRCLIRYDASTDFTEAELPNPPKRPLQPGETLKLRVNGKAVAVRVGGEHVRGSPLLLDVSGDALAAARSEVHAGPRRLVTGEAAQAAAAGQP